MKAYILIESNVTWEDPYDVYPVSLRSGAILINDSGYDSVCYTKS